MLKTIPTKTKTSSTAALLVWALFVIALIVVSPFVTIWALNTLFGLSIAYTIETWFAVVWLSLVSIGNIAYNKTTTKNA